MGRHFRIEYADTDGARLSLDRWDFSLPFVLDEARKLHGAFQSVRVLNKEGIVFAIGERRTMTVKVKVGARVDRWVTGRGGRNLFAADADRCRERLASVWGRENVRIVPDSYPIEHEVVDPDARLLDVDMPPTRAPGNVVSIFGAPMAFGGS